MQDTVTSNRRLNNRSVKIAGSALLGAMAFLLQTFVKFPFPLLPWLVFDFSEIPTVVGLFLFGPVWGILSSSILWLIMVIRGSAFPPGPYMKFAALVSMQVGIWFGLMIAKRLRLDKSLASMFVSGALVGLLFRVIVMAPLNYLVVGVLFARNFYFELASKGVSLIGITLSSQDQFMVLMLALSSVYNILHVFLSVIPAFAITRITPIIRQSWLLQNMGKRLGEPKVN